MVEREKNIVKKTKRLQYIISALLILIAIIGIGKCNNKNIGIGEI